MPTREPFLRFLNLRAEDFDFLDRYRPVLLQGADKFAESFYEYLFGKPETAEVLENINRKKLAALLAKQTAHFERLLTDRFSAQYREDLLHIGQIHQRLGIAPAWITGGYSLYKEHLTALADSSSVLSDDRARLKQVLSKLIFADLGLQLQGYASAQSEEDITRAALTRVLVDTVLMERSNGTWDSLMRRMCRGLVSKDTHILAAWGVMADVGSRRLALTCGVHIEEWGTPPFVSQHPNNPCLQALAIGEPLVIRVPEGGRLEWVGDALPTGSQEVAFIPFGKTATGHIGVGILVADYANYFQRIGLDHFKAFSHFGDLALSLRDQSLRDPLTALPNRTLFYDRMNHALSSASRRERLLAIGVLDLDGFKPINDQHGHAAGDWMLQQVAGRLRGVMRPTDTLARLGGDEFGLLLDDLETVSQLETLGDRLLDAIREPFKLDGRLVSLSASIGFTLHPLDDGDGETMLRHADMAMYSSKNSGHDRVTVYSAAMSAEAKWHAQLNRELRSGLETEALLLHYQPQIDMATGAVVGVEALLRWQHPNRGLLLPGDFLDALEKGPMSCRMGRYVLDRAVRRAAAWYEQGLSLRVAVNVGAQHLLSPEFTEDLHDILSRHGLPPRLLEIEVTETTAIADLSAASEALAGCRRLGITVALDDFGTGNAPLSYLQALPADSVKIDRGFVQGILRNHKDAAIVAGVITSARLLGLEVIAEGVETEEHGCLLLKLGCRRAQGYAIAKAMPGDAIPEWIGYYGGNPSWATWVDRPWKPEDYGVLMIALSHAERAREVQARLADPDASFPEHLLEPDSERRCALGRWLEGECSRFGDNPHFQTIKALHDRLHETARFAGELKAEQEPANMGVIEEKIREIRALSNAVQEQFREWLG